MLPWSLYDLTPRDQASALIRLVNFSGSKVYAGAGVNNELVYTVPDEQVFCFTHHYSRIQPAGAPSQHNWNAADSVGPRYRNEGQAYGVTFTLAYTISVTGSPIAILPQGSAITLQTNFAAGGGAVFYSINGVLVPRGTLAIN